MQSVCVLNGMTRARISAVIATNMIMDIDLEHHLAILILLIFFFNRFNGFT